MKVPMKTYKQQTCVQYDKYIVHLYEQHLLHV